MLSHESDALQTDAPLHAITLPLSSPYRSVVDVEDALEDAVDSACAPLIGTVPRPERLARRAALRQELDTLVAAHCELTAIPEQAVAEAIAHFARLHPAPVLHAVPQTQVTTQTTQKTRAASALPAMLLALGLLLPVYLLHVRDWSESVRQSIGLSEIALYRLDMFLVPLLAGLLVGAAFPRRGLRGMACACAALAAMRSAFPLLYWRFPTRNCCRLKIVPFTNGSLPMCLPVMRALSSGRSWAAAARRQGHGCARQNERDLRFRRVCLALRAEPPPWADQASA